MARVCHSCGKRPAFGQGRSHSMVATKRRFDANLQKVRITEGGAPMRVYVCTRCLKAGKVTKAERGPGEPVDDPSLVRFRAVVSAALAELENRRTEVNDLNVFPVADGDTGDNMALTMRAVLAELDRLSEQGELDEIGRDEIVDSVARAALLGARGNSGVILSQLISGAAEELLSRPGHLVDPALGRRRGGRASPAGCGRAPRWPAAPTARTGRCPTPPRARSSPWSARWPIAS